MESYYERDADNRTGIAGLTLGAVARVDSTATAFAHRAPGYSLLVVSQWTDPRDTGQNIAWAKETFGTLRPHMTDRS